MKLESSRIDAMQFKYLFDYEGYKFESIPLEQKTKTTYCLEGQLYRLIYDIRKSFHFQVLCRVFLII